MVTLQYRNSRGQLIDVSSVAATKVKNEFGNILEKAIQGEAIAITRHDAPKAVLISYEEFLRLSEHQAPNLEDLSVEFDALLSRMQTPRAKKNMARAFNASPDELGRVAVEMARRSRPTQRKRSTPTPTRRSQR
ncbi:MAG TPA: type II toxin-antitoxin system prevent-host-death family antitoxin [Nitrospira sp.]|nr:type II toxin-antitoxin system prevent-host-death family antitoxin [Nitrospira sp.]